MRSLLPTDDAARDRALLWLFALAAALARLPRLGFPEEEVFDEVYHAKTALEYLRGENPTEWVHPPTAKLIIAAGVWVFGYESWAWRLLPALAGVALAPVFFLLARRVLETRRAAVIATVLLLADGVYLVQSRTAMTNIFAVLFQLGAALFLVRAALTPVLPVREMVAAGLCLGLALSTRWTSLWATAFLGLMLLVVRGRRIFRPRELGLVALAFAVLPFLLYVVSYVPWMMQAPRPLDRLKDLGEHTRAVWRYHADLVAEHPYFSKWYTWPWLYRPTWYHFNQDAEKVRGIVALGNPALWWAAVPAAAWALLAGVRGKDARLLFAGFGFCCLYLPWGISPRTLNYGHYTFEAIPYACLALGVLADRLWDHAEWRGLARGYVALVLALFGLFFPFLTAFPVPLAWYYYSVHGWRPWTWFSTWV